MICAKEGCTFADTGVCVRNFNPPADCPELINNTDSDTNEVAGHDVSVEENTPDQYLPSGQVMNLLDVSKLTSNEYTQIVGILGAPNAGKTAALVSLYLMVSNGKLEGFFYRDSKTLLALEEISRGARRWSNGLQPEQLTTHTRSLDDRQAGFVHLRVNRSADQHTIALLLPDLPGEWTKSLVDSNTFERLSFLNSCEVIWIVIDGRDMRDRIGCRHELNKTELLLERLKQNLENFLRHEIAFVVTHADMGVLADDVLEPVTKLAEKLGFYYSVHHIASFSEEDAVKPGMGIAELLSASVRGKGNARLPIWPVKTVTHDRQMLNFKQVGINI